MAKREYYSEADEKFLHSNISSWQEKLTNISTNTALIDHESQDQFDYLFDHDEVGLKHPTNKSLVKITDDGFVDLFADDKVGIRIDPVTKSINLFGDLVNIFSKNINFRTNPNGLIWNSYYFNPDLYFESETERYQKIHGTKEYWHDPTHKGGSPAWHRDEWSIRPMIRSKTRYRYSQGMVDAIETMGLPTVPLNSWEKE